MVTVPAQSFWAPTRAKLIAAARDIPVVVRGRNRRETGKKEGIPGVWGVLESNELAGMTRTPLCFHASSGADDGGGGLGAKGSAILKECDELMYIQELKMEERFEEA
jgi:hypothetical protein